MSDRMGSSTMATTRFTVPTATILARTMEPMAPAGHIMLVTAALTAATLEATITRLAAITDTITVVCAPPSIWYTAPASTDGTNDVGMTLMILLIGPARSRSYLRSTSWAHVI